MRALVWFLCGFSLLFIQQVMALEWPHIKTKKISSLTYVIEHGPHDEPKEVSHGFHNNPGLVIDTGSSYEIGKMILRRIRAVTDKPITHIFTTHFHGDHWLANQALVEAYPEAKTIAHPKLIELLNNGEDKFWMDVFARRLGADFAGTRAVIPAIPAKNQVYTIGGIRFQVQMFEQAHTQTDLMVYVMDESVLFTGDIVNNEHFSFMGHGNFHGAYEATQWALSTGATHVVVGHGKSGTMELVKEFSHIYKTLLNEVTNYYEDGLMAYQMKPRLVASLDKYQKWSGFDSQIGRYTSQLVLEVEQRQFE